MVMWLRNLDRITKTLEETTQLNTLTFLDVGCGTGIPTLYAATRYEFADLRGFDFEAPLIEDARRNQEKVPKGRSALYVRRGRRISAQTPEGEVLTVFGKSFWRASPRTVHFEQFGYSGIDTLIHCNGERPRNPKRHGNERRFSST